jgi:hypothetical protein
MYSCSGCGQSDLAKFQCVADYGHSSADNRGFNVDNNLYTGDCLICDECGALQENLDMASYFTLVSHAKPENCSVKMVDRKDLGFKGTYIRQV